MSHNLPYDATTLKHEYERAGLNAELFERAIDGNQIEIDTFSNGFLPHIQVFLIIMQRGARTSNISKHSTAAKRPKIYCAA